MLKRPSNRERTEIQALAKRAVETHGGANLARAWYKFDCPHCGERCTAPEPNVLPEFGTCTDCRGISPIRAAGFALEVRKSRYVDWDQPTNTLVIRPQYASDRRDA